LRTSDCVSRILISRIKSLRTILCIPAASDYLDHRWTKWIAFRLSEWAARHYYITCKENSRSKDFVRLIFISHRHRFVKMSSLKNKKRCISQDSPVIFSWFNGYCLYQIFTAFCLPTIIETIDDHQCCRRRCCGSSTSMFILAQNAPKDLGRPLTDFRVVFSVR